jgi:hypothetical protein
MPVDHLDHAYRNAKRSYFRRRLQLAFVTWGRAIYWCWLGEFIAATEWFATIAPLGFVAG